MTKCIGTSIWIPYLLPETLQPQARNLIIPLLTSNVRLVAPAFAWSELGSVLRKKLDWEQLRYHKQKVFMMISAKYPLTTSIAMISVQEPM